MKIMKYYIRYLPLIPVLLMFVFGSGVRAQVSVSDLLKKIENSAETDIVNSLQDAEALDIHNAGIGDQPDIAIDSRGMIHIVSSRYKSFTCNYRHYDGEDGTGYTIIQWDTYHRTNGKKGTFQAVLYKSGKIMLSIKENEGAINEFPISGVNYNEIYGRDIREHPPESKTSWKFTWDPILSDYKFEKMAYSFWLDVKYGDMKPAWVEKDDCSWIIPLGFEFTFYDEKYEYCVVSSNGYINFYGGDSDDYSNPLNFPSADTSAFKVIAPLWDDWNPELKNMHHREVYYSMFSGYTNEMLIAPTLISKWDEHPSTRPAIEVDSDDKVHIIWRDEKWDDSQSAEITYTRLDPYKDARLGRAAWENEITLDDDTRLTNLGENWSTEPRMKIDSRDYIHIVWENRYEGIYYMRIADSGAVPVIEPTLVKEIPDAYNTSVEVAVDADNNAHVVWTDRKSTMNYEVYYAMIDGSNRTRKMNKLIDATLITEDDNIPDTRPTIEVYDEGYVALFWIETGDFELNHLNFTIIDPSLDDRNGNAADYSNITLVETNQPIYNEEFISISSDIDNDNNIHLTWWDGFDYEIDHAVFFSDGNFLQSELEGEMIVFTPSKWMAPRCAAYKNEKVYFTWFDLNLSGVAFSSLNYVSGSNPGGVNLEDSDMPEKNILLQNYPNPFNPATKIGFFIKNTGMVSIEIFDIAGRQIKTFDIGSKSPGMYEVTWDGRTDKGIAAAGGIYFCKLRSAGMTDIKKMILMK